MQKKILFTVVPNWYKGGEFNIAIQNYGKFSIFLAFLLQNGQRRVKAKPKEVHLEPKPVLKSKSC